MSVPSSGRRARAKDRRTWSIESHALGAEPNASLRNSTTAAERLAMMWELAEQAWFLSGRALPQYRRSEIPGRIVRPPK